MMYYNVINISIFSNFNEMLVFNGLEDVPINRLRYNFT